MSMCVSKSVLMTSFNVGYICSIQSILQNIVTYRQFPEAYSCSTNLDHLGKNQLDKIDWASFPGYAVSPQ